MENNQSFWQFSDELRTQNSNLANLSLNDSIWSNSHASKRLGERRNFDIRVGGDVNSPASSVDNLKSDFNGFNHGWKIGLDSIGIGSFGALSAPKDMLDVGINGGFNKGIYSSPPLNYNKSKGYYNSNSNNKNSNALLNTKANKNGKGDDEHGHVGKKKNKNYRDSNKDNNNNSSENGGKNSVEKRFKTLPPSEALPRNETVGGYIFVCNNDTMQENLKRQLFGLPPRYRDSVRAITPGLPLFLYNYSTHQLYGIFEAASFGGTNIDPKAWEDKKNPGESRFPAQVRVLTRKICDPLDEDAFRPILYHYDGPKFRLELSVPEALSLLDIFAETSP